MEKINGKKTFERVWGEKTRKEPIRVTIMEAGVGEGHPKMECSWCDKKFEDPDEGIATCTQTEYVTLCDDCYKKAGNRVR